MENQSENKDENKTQEDINLPIMEPNVKDCKLFKSTKSEKKKNNTTAKPAPLPNSLNHQIHRYIHASEDNEHSLIVTSTSLKLFGLGSLLL
jgi:hypothetical protein